MPSATNIDGYFDRVQALIRDDANELGRTQFQTDWLDAIEQGVREYSLRRPRFTVKDIVSDGTGDIDTATTTLTGFDEEFFKAVGGQFKIEWPITATAGVRRKYYHRDQWQLYRTPTKLFLRLLTVPTNGETVRVEYPVMHTLNETTNTILASDFWTVAHLSAASAADLLSIKYTHTDAIVLGGADQATFNFKDQRWAEKAKMHRQLAWPKRGMQVA